VADFVVLTLTVELYLPESGSLKAKRSSVKRVLEGAKRRWSVSAAEVGGLRSWQRTVLAFATVSNSASKAQDVMDEVERWVWTTPDAEVLETRRYWLDTA
jgi:uncharacterized protein YlxP (DUF503 family)